MEQNINEEDLRKEVLRLEIRTKKLQVWIAILTLIGISITTLSTLILSRIDDVKILLTEKPLEGIWQYSSKYETGSVRSYRKL